MEPAFPTFTTKNLTFGPARYQDVQDIFQLFSDPDTMRLDGGKTMVTLDEAYEFVRFYSVYQPQFPIIRWVVRRKQTGEFLGTGGYYKIDIPSQRAEIGGELSKKHWKNGIATEAMEGMIAFGFKELNFNRITAMISPDNEAANALVKKGGFTCEGCLRQWENWGNKWMDLNIYRLLKEEWTSNA